MKTAVIGEDGDGVVSYNSSPVALLDHYGSAPRACRPYRAKTRGRVERPFRYVRQDFFLGRTFRDIDDLDAQFDQWRRLIANGRVHATTGRVVDEALAEEQPGLIPLPVIAYSAVLSVERRVSHEGMVSLGGNLYSVPDATSKRTVEVQNHPNQVRIFEDGVLIATHPALDGRNQRRVDPAHRNAPPAQPPRRVQTTTVARRSLDLYGAVGRRLAVAEGSQ